MNLRNVIILAAIAALAFFGWRWFAAGEEALVEPGSVQRVLAIGDSLTAGVPADGVQAYWPDLVARRLGASEVVRMAAAGDTVASAWNRWEPRLRAGQWKEGDPGWRPDLVIVCLGGNDIRRSTGATALERQLDQWAQALRILDVPVLFVAVPGGIGPTDSYAGTWRDVARRHGMHDMHQRTLRRVFTNRDLTVDGIHMNQAGQEYFAEHVYRRIIGG